ncbi:MULTISPECIES: DUF305 domain-containing protein [unclassified Chelatococcus]|uniref:DUF305 domain-containing protein n=2 Tax=unclassified Chelatococcus TaxID=2638111 RepID=UPI001BD1192D|nr:MULTISPECIES: DUF305 domain-containing protein [unclassified Chelatococcus]CAH1655067.1 conserved membrane hypothetical protein [Hyphomicrobiales bacterium]MBS7742700.1 DUF305 domain-containing protein [Chelatococcus sp. HY11]MBX3542182.1 DUF305 domain-containing protein [Chelatococcus sp.]MCO5075601.1 DUF305 domain-containing protein [Chelatococcus sp.]CAH1695246.1 conserved membrane hypothetical protein [Hyphomicrobiales bacterium]
MMDHQQSARHGRTDTRSYVMLAINFLLGLIVMYVAMFTMIDGWQDFHNNINMLYMALTMAAPMGIIMLATMGRMYTRRGLNTALYLGFAALSVASFAATRTQALVEDRQFIASMIPHHSGAILMCRQNHFTDQELARLCDDIIRSQRNEIEQMNRIRSRLEAGMVPQ